MRFSSNTDSCLMSNLYAFQGQESDDEIKGDGNSVNYKYRMHDPRLGRFFAIDPLAAEYPHNSVYAFSENKVIAWVELEGLEATPAYDESSYWYAWLFDLFGTDKEHVINKKIEDAKIKATRVTQDALIITGGVIVSLGTGGIGTIIIGGAAAVGGGVKLYHDVNGEYDLSDETPTTISGTVYVTINYLLNGKKTNEKVLANVEIIEGVLTFNFKGLTNISKLTETEKVAMGFDIANLTIDLKSATGDLKNILRGDSAKPVESTVTERATVKDETNIILPKAKIVMPSKEEMLKNINKNKKTKKSN